MNLVLELYLVDVMESFMNLVVWLPACCTIRKTPIIFIDACHSTTQSHVCCPCECEDVSFQQPTRLLPNRSLHTLVVYWAWVQHLTRYCLARATLPWTLTMNPSTGQRLQRPSGTRWGIRTVGCKNQMTDLVHNMNHTCDTVCGSVGNTLRHMASGPTSTVKDGVLSMVLEQQIMAKPLTV